MMKFGTGCVSYLLSVVLLSFRDLAGVPGWQLVALVVGLMSMGMTLGVAMLLETPLLGYRPRGGATHPTPP